MVVRPAVRRVSHRRSDGDRNEPRPATKLPYQARPRRGNSSFHTRCSSEPIPVAKGSASSPATASHNDGTSTRSEGKSRAKPTSSTNAAARAIDRTRRPLSNQRRSRALPSAASPLAQASSSTSTQSTTGSASEVQDVETRLLSGPCTELSR